MVTVSLMAGDGLLIEIPPGVTVVGRGDLLKIYDKRLSRQQASIEVANDGTVSFVALGVNPTQLCRRGEKERSMKKNKKYIVGNGDYFTLLTNLYPFTFRIKDGTTKQATTKQTTTTTTTTTTTSTLSKDKGNIKEQKMEKPTKDQKMGKPTKDQDMDLHYEDEGDADNSTQVAIQNKPPQSKSESKAPKPNEQQGSKRKHDDSDDDWGSGSEDEKTKKHKGQPKKPCPFGQKCYRTKNPDHIKEFTHSPASSPKKVDVVYDEDDEALWADLESKKATKPVADKPPQVTKPTQANHMKPKSVLEALKKASQSQSSDSDTKQPTNDTKDKIQPPAKPKSKPAGKWSVAFPLLATAVNMFETAKAIQICSEAISSFKENHPTLEVKFVCVVDAGKEPEISAAFEETASKNDVEVVSSNITEMNTRVVAIEANWRLKEESRYKQLYAMAGDLMGDTKARHTTTGSYGNVYAVPVSKTSEFGAQGVEWIVHCVVPNMNPAKPDCKGYNEAGPLLQKTFENLFDCIYKISEGEIM